MRLETVTFVVVFVLTGEMIVFGGGVVLKSTIWRVIVAEWDTGLDVPVIVSVLLPAVLALQVTVAVPDPVTVCGLIVKQVSPIGTVSDSWTVAANPLSAIIVIVIEAPMLALMVAGAVAVRVKSWNLKIMLLEWERVPLVPVIVRV